MCAAVEAGNAGSVCLYVCAGIWESLSSVVAGSCAGWVMWVVVAAR
jgi:hypothetical protein